MPRGRTVLVTGGAGFIGSAAVRALLARGDRVVTLDALTYAGHRETLGDALHHPAHRFVHGDVGDATVVARLLAEHGPDAVLHCAAETHVDRSIADAAPFVRTNAAGTATLVGAVQAWWRTCDDATRAAFRLVVVSTDEVFGALDPDDPPFDAASPVAPRSPYAASKAAGDLLALAAWHTHGLPVVVTHCGNNYGPYQFPEKLVPVTIERALREEPVAVYGTGANVRDWIHVDDHVAGLLRALDAGVPGARYLFGHEPRANVDVVHALLDAVDAVAPRGDGSRRRGLVTFVADRPGHDFRYAIDWRATGAALGWAPSRTLAAALPEVVRWYVANDAWRRTVLARAGYAAERLGAPALAGR